MKLSVYAKKLGVTYRTAWNMYHRGDIPNAYALPSGTIIVHDDSATNKTTSVTKNVCIYARVSSSQNKQNLETQVERLKQYCIANGWTITRIVKEIASGINDKRPLLTDVLSKINEYDYVVVEHKDRLTRLGFNYFESFVPNKFHVVNTTQDKTEDLMQDLVSIITSFCARLYGQRKGKRKTENIIKELNSKDD